jgi:hypothetical protein
MTGPFANLQPIPDTCSYLVWNPAVNIDSSGLPLDSILWDFGANNVPPSSNQLNPGPVTFIPQTGNLTQTVTFYAENACGVVRDTITFVHQERINLSGGQDTILCTDDSIYCLTPNVPGGVWTFNGVPDSAFCFDPNTVPDTFLVFYQVDSLGCTFIDTVEIIVSDPPVVEAGGPYTVCPDDTLVLTGTPVGGVWSGPISINGNVVVSDSSGTFTFYYCYEESLSGCSNCDSALVTVFPPNDNVDAGGSVTFCFADVVENLPTPSPSGGLWSGPGLVDPVAGTFNPDSVGLGTHFVYYTHINSDGCTGRDTLTVNVINITPASAGPDLSFCTNDPIYTLPGNQQWSSAAPGFTSPNLFDPSAMSGSFLFTYTVAPGTSCEDSDLANFTVFDTLAVNAGPNLDVCAGEAQFTLGGNSPVGGVWSGTGVVDGNLGLFDPDSLNPGQTVVLVYSVTDTTGCVSRSVRSVTLRPLPVVSIEKDSLYCQLPGLLTLPNASPQPGLWSGMPMVDSALGVFDPFVTGTGVFTVYYSHVDGFGCENLDSAIITIDTPAVVSIGFGDTVLCVNDVPFTLDNFFPLSGDWYGNGFVLPNLYDPGQAGVGVDTLVYCYGSFTCRVCDTVLVTVQDLPVVDAGSYADVCQFSSDVLLGAGNPAGGIWTGPNVIQIGPDYYFQPLLTGMQTLTYTYTDPNTQCTNTDQTSLLVNPLPVVSIAGDTTYCRTGGLQGLPAVNLGPGIWSGPTPPLVDPSNGIIDPDTVGVFEFSYLYVDGNGCENRDTITVTIVEPDSVSAGQNDTVCVNEGTYVLPNFYPLPPDGQWFGDGIVDNINGIYSPAQASVGLDTVVYCTGAGSCYICDTITILVEPTPPLAAVPDSMCLLDPALSLDNNGSAFGTVAAGVWTGPFVSSPAPGSYEFGPALRWVPIRSFTVLWTASIPRVVAIR